MKLFIKARNNSYQEILIQDESGIDLIKVTKQILQSLSATRIAPRAIVRVIA